MVWQPIESAPKSGVAVLLYEPKMTRRYALNGGSKCCVGRHADDWGWVSIPGDYARKPTHWMPLPEPPQSERTGA